MACGKAPPLANTPASGSQQAAQLSPRAAPPAECHYRKIKSEVKPSSKRSAFADKPCLLASLSRNMYCIKESPPDVWWTTMLK